MQIHVVQSGQSLYGISRLMGSPFEEIAAANEIDPILPSGSSLGHSGSPGRYYSVQPGDSLFTIARRFGIDAGTIASVNGLSPDQPLQLA